MYLLLFAVLVLVKQKIQRHKTYVIDISSFLFHHYICVCVCARIYLQYIQVSVFYLLLSLHACECFEAPLHVLNYGPVLCNIARLYYQQGGNEQLPFFSQVASLENCSKTSFLFWTKCDFLSLGPVETAVLPFPKWLTCSWDNDNFGNYPTCVQNTASEFCHPHLNILSNCTL